MGLNSPVVVQGSITKNFTVREIANPKARDYVKLTFTPSMLTHIIMMQELRDAYGKALVVSSWYRTRSFNATVGGNAKSEHLIGCATDITGIPGEKREWFIETWKRLCDKYGRIGNIGLYSWGMHFGSRGDRYGYTEHKVFKG